MTTLDAPALFVIDEDGYRPTPLCGSPWSPDALHGGPPAALLARAIERFEGESDFFVVRLTVELVRPVPFTRLTVPARMTRPGRKVQLVEAKLESDGMEVARATGLRIRRGAVALPPGISTPGSPPEWAAPATHEPEVPGPERGEPPGEGVASFHPGFHTHGVEHRFVRGSFEEAGPAIDWIRVKVPFIEGEPLSPLCRACAAADFGNGISGVLRGTHRYINPDLTVYLHRYPIGEWVCLDAVTRVETHGIGMAESLLRDERGPIGRAVQSLLIEALGT